MKSIVALVAFSTILFGVHAGTTTLIRSPQYDSAVIQSDRLGGNFAYSSVEGQAYTAYSPIVRSTYHPVAYEYTAYPAYQPYTTYHPAQSILLQQPFISTFPTIQFGAQSTQHHHQQIAQRPQHEDEHKQHNNQQDDEKSQEEHNKNSDQQDDTVTIESA